MNFPLTSVFASDSIGFIIFDESDKIVDRYLPSQYISLANRQNLPDCQENDQVVFVESRPIISRCFMLKSGYRLFLFFDYSSYNKEYSDILYEYQIAWSISFDEMIVVDTQGKVIRVVGDTVALYGVKQSEMLGKNVFDLEQQGFFYPSATSALMKSGEIKNILQTTRKGHRQLVKCFPINDGNGNVDRYVNVSRDVTELTVLHSKIRELSSLIDHYRDLLSAYSSINKIAIPKGGITILGASREIKQVHELIKKVALSDATVLLQGESGVGKDLVARNIHMLSNRAAQPFYKINCGSIPESLLESELFGYAKGAFTGATAKGKLGLLEMANHGTLFLDEIGDMPLSLQIKILNVIQDKEFKRIGEVSYRDIDVRIIAATHRNLAQMVKNSEFRADLFYRINVFPIYIAPLRERKEDIHLLAQYFLNIQNDKYNISIRLTEDALALLEHYQWPGNVRELGNLIERLVILSHDNEITGQMVKKQIDINNQNSYGVVETQLDSGEYAGAANDSLIEVKGVLPWKDATDILADKLFPLAVKKYGSIVEAAKYLNVHYSTVSRKLKITRLPQA